MEVLMLSKLRTALRSLLRKSEMERELDEELRHHIEQQTEQNIRLGMSPEEARCAARKAFGGVEQAKEWSRDARGVRWIEDLWQDLRYGARMLVKNPGFTLIAVVTLALGIGANTAIFSVVNSVLLGSLPYKDSDRLVVVWDKLFSKGVDELELSPNDFFALRDRNTVFEQMGAVEKTNLNNLTGDGEPLRLEAKSATANLFPMLGIPPLLGRTFTPEEDRAYARVAVLSYKLWQSRFAGDKDVIGRNVTINGHTYTVIGVMPAEFEYPPPGSNQPPGEIWFPRALETDEAKRDSHNLLTVARLKPGVTFAQARADLENIARRREQEARINTDKGVNLVPLQDQIGRKLRAALLTLAGAVGFVLLIACANVANLLLSQAAGRASEIAIRLALGASRWRIARQLLTESLLLSLFGGAFGLLIAAWMEQGIRLLGATQIPRAERLAIEGRALGFTLLVMILTGVVFGLAPALQASRPDVNETLKGGGRAAKGASRQRLRNGLVVAEVALSLALLVGAGLLIKSFWHLQQVELGFDARNVLSLDFIPSRAKHPYDSSAAFYQQLLEKIQTLPGVKAAAIVNNAPLSGRRGAEVYKIEGRPEPKSMADAIVADYHVVSPGYFQMMGIPLLRGRAFTESDGPGAPGVAIINQVFAERYWPGEDPLGRRLLIDFNQRWVTVVGVVGNIKQSGAPYEAAPHVSVPYKQMPEARTLLVRTTADPLSFVGAARSQIQAIDRDLPIYNIHTMEDLLAESISQRWLNLLLLGAFAGVALALTVVGLYGVISSSVTQRTHEIGVRVALGAQSRDVLRLVIGQGMKLVVLGVSIGLAAAFELTRLLKTLLFGVSATDPLTFAGVSLLLFSVALLACYLPARKAAQVDPLVALRRD
jgi:putative ABC transport system permease protein